MRRFAQIILLACLSALTSAALAFATVAGDTFPAEVETDFEKKFDIPLRALRVVGAGGTDPPAGSGPVWAR